MPMSNNIFFLSMCCMNERYTCILQNYLAFAHNPTCHAHTFESPRTSTSSRTSKMNLKDLTPPPRLNPNRLGLDLSLSSLDPKLGGGGSIDKKQRAIKKGSNIFIVDKFCKKCTCNIMDFIIMKHVYM